MIIGGDGCKFPKSELTETALSDPPETEHPMSGPAQPDPTLLSGPPAGPPEPDPTLQVKSVLLSLIIHCQMRPPDA